MGSNGGQIWLGGLQTTGRTSAFQRSEGVTLLKAEEALLSHGDAEVQGAQCLCALQPYMPHVQNYSAFLAQHPLICLFFTGFSGLGLKPLNRREFSDGVRQSDLFLMG